MFSKRVQGMEPSPIRKFTPASEKAAREGKQVIPLNIGQPDIETPPVFFDAVRTMPDKVISYTSSYGTNELRDAFSAYYSRYGMPYTREDILVTQGGSEGLLFTLAALCDDGDEILVFEPFYSNYGSIARIVGARLVPVPTDYENNYRLPGEEAILSRVTPRTKGILVTNPNNPTGLVLRREEMDSIVSAATKAGLMIVSDEVYREFTYDAPFIPFTEYAQILDNLVIIDSVSKRFSGCGIRIGCVASKNQEFMAHILKLCQSRLCPPFVEQAGAAALFNRGYDSVAATRDEYMRRRDVCVEVLSGAEGINFRRPEGAFYFLLSLPVEDADDFAGWLLSEYSVDGETVMLCPAKDCYADSQRGKREIRISYCIDPDRLRRGLAILVSGLKAYNDRKPALKS